MAKQGQDTAKTEQQGTDGQEATALTTTARVFKVSTRRVQAFYAFLCDLGLDDFVQAAIDLKGKQPVQPVTADQQTGKSAKGKQLDVPTNLSEAAGLVLSLDMRKLFTVFGKEGRLVELVAIVCDVSEEEALDLDMGRFDADFPDFVAAWMLPIEAVLGLSRFIA